MNYDKIPDGENIVMEVDLDNFNQLDYESALRYRNELVEEYGLYAEQSRKMVIKYLERYDSERLSAYLGYTNLKNCIMERNYIRGTLSLAEHLIADMLKGAANGNEAATPEVIDRFARLYLGLPYAVIQGGKSE